jgi:hypothetical protein
LKWTAGNSVKAVSCELHPVSDHMSQVQLVPPTGLFSVQLISIYRNELTRDGFDVFQFELRYLLECEACRELLLAVDRAIVCRLDHIC